MPRSKRVATLYNAHLGLPDNGRANKVMAVCWELSNTSVV